MASRLVFSGGRFHTYSLDGRKVPGVTTVIGRATDKPALVYASAREAATWAAANMEALDILGPDAWIRQAAGTPRSVWDAKAKRGTLLHDAARQLVAGLPVTPAEDWPDDVIRSAEQLARFMDQWDVDPAYTERPVFHSEHRWAGTVDLVGILRDGRRYLLDYKTGETGIYPKDAIQLAAYRHATHMQVEAEPDDTSPAELVDIPMPEVDECACVWVRPDFYELRPVLADLGSYEVFRHMIQVAKWSQWDRDETVFQPLPVPAVAS